MNWWNSFETLSKLQTALAISITALGIITLTFKVRADHLKKLAEPPGVYPKSKRQTYRSFSAIAKGD